MSAPVKVHVYDLSKGLAGQLSLHLTGKQIDGVWLVSSGIDNQDLCAH
jgi:hypothetical protein